MANPFRIPRLLLIVLAITAALLPTKAPAQAGRPLPAGQAAANDATRQSEQVEPPVAARPTVSAADVQKQADELLSLAQQVHIGTQRAAEGLLDKDLKDKLKRIEKLSKKLRDELAL